MIEIWLSQPPKTTPGVGSKQALLFQKKNRAAVQQKRLLKLDQGVLTGTGRFSKSFLVTFFQKSNCFFLNLLEADYRGGSLSSELLVLLSIIVRRTAKIGAVLIEAKS